MIQDNIEAEPTVFGFNRILVRAWEVQPDVVIGLGGGSALDVAKRTNA